MSFSRKTCTQVGYENCRLALILGRKMGIVHSIRSKNKFLQNLLFFGLLAAAYSIIFLILILINDFSMVFNHYKPII